jgi:hypothetical protein
VTFQAVSRWLRGEDAFLQLPAPQRKLIREVILTFAKVHGGAAPTAEGAGRETVKIDSY